MSKRKYEIHQQFIKLLQGRMDLLGYQCETDNNLYALYVKFPSNFGVVQLMIPKYELEDKKAYYWMGDFRQTVYIQIEFAMLASQVIDCNKYSGKWNKILHLEFSFEDEVDRFFDDLREILLEKDTTLVENIKDVDVVFREHKEYGTIALFPYDIVGRYGLCNSCTITGQHKAVDYTTMLKETKPSNGNKLLQNKLKELGYNINIIKRRSKKKFDSVLIRGGLEKWYKDLENSRK